ncbi:MAG: DUF3783 domain-containing protein [Thermodesulfobacteriota bacterium]
MTHKKGFTRVKNSEVRMYGPRCFILCGYLRDEKERISDLLAELGMLDVILKPVNQKHLHLELKGIMHSNADPAYEPQISARAIIMAGISENELKKFMHGWKGLKFPAQQWAVLTPTSENWTLTALLTELKKEAAAMAGKGRKKNNRHG